MSQQSSPDIDPVTGLPWPVDIYGRPMRPDDPFLPVQRQRGRWARGARNLDLPRHLARGVGRHMPNDPSDVAAVEMWLGQAGYYDLERREGPTGYGSPTVDDAILRFQKDHGLTADGWAGPGGETEKALQQAVGPALAGEPVDRAPTVSAKPNLLTIEPGIQLARMDKRDLPYQRSWQGLEGGFAGGGRGGGRSAPQPPAAKPPTEPPPSPQVAPQPLPNRPLVVPAPAVHPDALQDKSGLQPPADRTPATVGDYLVGDLETTLGKHPGSLGGPGTQLQNKILSEQCREVMEKEFMPGYLGMHTNGGFMGNERLTEEVVRPKGQEGPNFLGSVRPDFTWEITLPDGTKETIRMNSASTRKDGTLTKREAEALRKLREYTRKDFTDWIAKEKGAFSVPEFTKKARNKCREIFGDYIDVRRVY